MSLGFILVISLIIITIMNGGFLGLIGILSGFIIAFLLLKACLHMAMSLSENGKSYYGEYTFISIYLGIVSALSICTITYLNTEGQFEPYVIYGLPAAIVLIVFPLLIKWVDVCSDSYLKRCSISFFFHLYVSVFASIIFYTIK
jgi:hypothetical protein